MRLHKKEVTYFLSVQIPLDFCLNWTSTLEESQVKLFDGCSMDAPWSMPRSKSCRKKDVVWQRTKLVLDIVRWAMGIWALGHWTTGIEYSGCGTLKTHKLFKTLCSDSCSHMEAQTTYNNWNIHAYEELRDERKQRQLCKREWKRREKQLQQELQQKDGKLIQIKANEIKRSAVCIVWGWYLHCEWMNSKSGAD